MRALLLEQRLRTRRRVADEDTGVVLKVVSPSVDGGRLGEIGEGRERAR